MTKTGSDDVSRESNRLAAKLMGALIGTFAFVGLVIYAGSRPPDATITNDTLSVDGIFSRSEIRLADVIGTSLEHTLPTVRGRTAGFQGVNSLRGHFVLDRFGPAELYIEPGHPPYVFVRARSRLIVVNFRDPARTTAFYEVLTKRIATQHHS